jgi:hypothetical protein
MAKFTELLEIEDAALLPMELPDGSKGHTTPENVREYARDGLTSDDLTESSTKLLMTEDERTLVSSLITGAVHGMVGDASINLGTAEISGTDDTVALQAAVDAAIADGVRPLRLAPGRSYRVSSQITITDSLTIDLNGSTILADFEDSSTGAIFRFEGAGVDDDTTTTATAQLDIADASGIEPGDYIQIVSTEYWGGISGVSGYRVKNKGELNRVRYKSGNTLTVETAFRHSDTNRQKS